MPKPRKVEEAAGAYQAAKKAKPPTAKKQRPEPGKLRYANDQAFRAAAERVFQVHDEILRKLAQ